ncbi:MAG: hypothetical protein K1X67_10895 [Fimbriimonadaceae bacterium]|nr:hypothetical protein [Fimbriimonadaceae bacterium]
MNLRTCLSILALGCVALAHPFNATIQLDTPNVVIDNLNAGQLTATMSGTIQINEPFVSFVLWIPYAYHEDDMQNRNDYTLRNEFLQWIQTLVGQPGMYHGPIFDIQMDPNDKGGLYNHVFGSFTVQPLIYLYKNGNSMDRSNEVPYTIQFIQPGRITGTVTLEDYEPDEEFQYVELVIRKDGTDHFNFVPLGPGGAFELETGFGGPAEILVKNWHWLRKSSGPITLGQPIVLDFSLTNGDCDGDNEVGIGDYALISSSYGLVPGDENYLYEADLNGDEEVGIADYAILSANYGMMGDE